MPPDNKGDITDEEKDDEDLTKRHVIQDVAGKVEVFYPSLENSEKEKVTRTKSAKVS